MNSRELATVLAALRYWQREGLMSSGGEQDIATECGSFERLTAEQIDALCERLNTGICGTTLTNEDRFNYSRLPNLAQLQRYVEQRVPVGHFLSAVICNDLGEAVARADDQNQWLIPIYYRWLYNEAPAQCWGSKEKMLVWLKNQKRTRCDYEIKAIVLP